MLFVSHMLSQSEFRAAVSEKKMPGDIIIIGVMTLCWSIFEKYSPTPIAHGDHLYLFKFEMQNRQKRETVTADY